jgi:hypothetical protein
MNEGLPEAFEPRPKFDGQTNQCRQQLAQQQG